MTNSEISLPSSHQHERDKIKVVEKNCSQQSKIMHIGGFNFLQQNKTVESGIAATNSPSDDVRQQATSVLKEFNKNSTNDNFKVKKYKFGHVNKSFEPSSAYGM